jgi:hypothetical protein
MYLPHELTIPQPQDVICWCNDYLRNHTLDAHDESEEAGDLLTTR